MEVASGLSLEEFFRSRIFEPLGMTDTTWSVSQDDADRLASLYLPGPGRKAVSAGAMGRRLCGHPMRSWAVTD